MLIWPASLSVKGASKRMSWFPPIFSGALVNATVLTLLFRNVAVKKRFSRGVLANTARFLRISSLETVCFLAPEGITNFGTALAKHCNHVFCSFVLQIDWLKLFPGGLRSSIWCKWLGDETKCRSSSGLPLDQGRAINSPRGPLWEGRVNGGPYLMEVEASFDL